MPSINMKILFLTDNFPPEVNAPASRTFEHCREWVKLGADVTIVTCFPNFPQGKVYDGYKNKLYAKETIEGIKVIRVWSYITSNSGFIRRTLDFISFSISSFFAGLFIKSDLIIATSPQFFTALSGRTLSFFKRTPWIMEVRDLWPESIKTVGVMKDNIFIRYLEWEEMRCYRSAKRIIVVTDTFKEILTKRGIVESKIDVIKNGVSKDLFSPMNKDSDIVNLYNLKDKIVIGYIGTHGIAHKLDFIVNAAQKVKNKNIYFLFIGDGAKREHLLRLCSELQCDNITMIPSVPKSEVNKYISVLDVGLINLRKSDLFRSVIPSKIFENAAMQIPILIGVDGEARQIIESFNAGVFFEPENETDFLNKLEVIQDVEKYREYKLGCQKLAIAFDRGNLAREMYKIIKNIL